MIRKYIYYFLLHYNCLFNRKSLTAKVKYDVNSYNYFKRKFYHKISPINTIEEPKEKIIWVCWLQGIEKSPILVQKCFKSIVRNIPKEYELKLITEKNFKEYIELPDFILEKWGKGIISNAHFSDLIRLQLLIKYGGVWIDPTCYMTNTIPNFLLDMNMFFFSNYNRNSKIKISNWFLISDKNNAVFLNTYNCLIEFWRKHNYCVNYFLFHYIFSITLEKLECNIYDNYISNIVPHTLSYIANNICDDEYICYIKKFSFIYKLNTKHQYNLEKNSILYRLLYDEVNNI